MFSIKFCKSKKAIEVDPTNKIQLDLDRIRENFNVMLDAGIVIVMKIDNEEVLVHSFGKLVFNKLRDTDKVRKISEKIYGYVK